MMLSIKYVNAPRSPTGKYGSLKLQHDVAKMLSQRRAQSRQSPIIYFISDHHPSGLDLQRSWVKALTDFGLSIRLVRIGLTREQVDDLDLGHLAIGVKPSGRRPVSYVEEHGTRCWEADVLPANVIEHAPDDHVRSWTDTKLWERRASEIERARKLP